MTLDMKKVEWQIDKGTLDIKNGLRRTTTIDKLVFTPPQWYIKEIGFDSILVEAVKNYPENARYLNHSWKLVGDYMCKITFHYMYRQYWYWLAEII